MSINNSYTVEIIESDGSTTRFRFNFFIFNKQELKIKIAEEDGNFTDLEYETDYSVENSLDYSTGGYVNLVEAVEQGKNIIFYRETDILQQINLVYLQTLNPKTLTAMFDKLTAIAQELNNEFYRSFKFDYEPLSAIDQTKVLNEYNIKHLDPNNTNKIVAVAFKYNEDTGKWQLTTTSSDPDSYQQQITENKNNITATNGRIDSLDLAKQDKLIAGRNITIDQATNTISANDTPETTMEAGENIEITQETIPVNKVIISVSSTLANQVEQNKQDVLNKQDKLTAGENITIENNVISAQTGGTEEILKRLSALENEVDGKLDATENMTPSNNYDDLTWSGNFVKYTAPANGYITAVFDTNTNTMGGIIVAKDEYKEQTINESNWLQARLYGDMKYSENNHMATIPVRKGAVFFARGISGTPPLFRFIYSNNNS